MHVGANVFVAANPGALPRRPLGVPPFARPHAVPHVRDLVGRQVDARVSRRQEGGRAQRLRAVHAPWVLHERSLLPRCRPVKQ